MDFEIGATSKALIVFTPVLPPGINDTYGHGRAGQVYKKDYAKVWEQQFKLLTINKVNFQEWKDTADRYVIKVYWWGGGHDADAHLKLAQDAFTRACGFDDRKIKIARIEKLDLDEVSWVFEKYDFKDNKKGLVVVLEEYCG
jgi:hypothetical protein